MEHINAPYNFVPLSDKVVTPEWAAQVSQDLPFRDGISGELALTIEALSPIMSGGEQKQGSKDESGQVHFFKTPSTTDYPQGRYAIPGSGLRGAIRNVFEIATFSRMNRIDNKRYGLRDITGKHVSESYTERVRGNVRYGFLSLNETGDPCITPCSMTRLSHRFLEKLWNVKAPIFPKRMTVQEKYGRWLELCGSQGIADAINLGIDQDGDEVTSIGSLTEKNIQGYPVFTGQISDKTDDTRNKQGKWIHGKYKDFVFHSPETESFLVSEADSTAWRNFLFIHGDEETKQNMSWPNFWRAKFRIGERVPVFYIRTTDRLQIGLAYMPKLAGDFSTHDMLKHTHDDHLDLSDPDMTSLVFGQVGDSPVDSFKGRVNLEPAFLQGTPEVNDRPNETILNGAKPSYFPNYIYQKTNVHGNLAGGQYATYVYSKSNPAPELRGWKRYPVRDEREIKTQPLGDKQSRAVQTKLYNLKAGAKFKSRLTFHNLKPVELGALLWVLKFEENRHSLGMGKSFGYGQVQISLNWDERLIQCNDTKNSPSSDYDSYVQIFQEYMSEKIGSSWSSTASIAALVAMSSIERRSQFDGELKHMILGRGRDGNEFTVAKKKGLVLEGYVTDERTLKRFSHVSLKDKSTAQESSSLAEEKHTWVNAHIVFEPGSNRLTATAGSGKAMLDGSDAKTIFGGLSKSAQKKAKQGTLIKSVEVITIGNMSKIDQIIN